MTLNLTLMPVSLADSALEPMAYRNRPYLVLPMIQMKMANIPKIKRMYTGKEPPILPLPRTLYTSGNLEAVLALEIT